MSAENIAEELMRLINVRTRIRNNVAAKGVTGVSNHTFDELADDIENIVSLPNGISKMKFGNATISIDVSANTLSHNLGSVPDIVAAYTTDSSLWAATANAPAILATIRFVEVSGSLGSGYKTLSIWRNADGTIGGGINPAYGIIADPTTTQFTISGAQSVPVAGGKEYKWFAIKLS